MSGLNQTNTSTSVMFFAQVIDGSGLQERCCCGWITDELCEEQKGIIGIMAAPLPPPEIETTGFRNPE